MAKEFCTVGGGCFGLSENEGPCTPGNNPGDAGPCQIVDSEGGKVVGTIGPGGFCCPDSNPPVVGSAEDEEPQKTSVWPWVIGGSVALVAGYFLLSSDKKGR